jgi:hypothetical protein
VSEGKTVLNAQQLNKKLATKVMGWTVKNDHAPPYRSFYIHEPTGTLHGETHNWNPVGDLEQLRECYFALSEDERKAVWLHITRTSWDQEIPEFLDMFEHQELYAQAILKAKEEKL